VDFEIKFQKNLDVKHENDVWKLLCECDYEFVPPLSSRESSFQSTLADSGNSQGCQPESYFEVMKKQHFLLGFSGREVIAFMTFRGNYECEELSAVSPSNYITTICVKKRWRRNGVARKFYHFMLSSLDINSIQPFVTTRTWSTNLGHINLLSELGFSISANLPDHRGVGIDTIYFSKQI